MMTTDECYLSIYGTLRRHPWLDEDTHGHDAYSLFNTYSEAFRWSTGATYPQYTNTPPEDPRRDIAMWGMHEAGGDWSDETNGNAAHLLWVETGLTKPAKRAGLPIAQLGLCAEKVLNRIGIVSLEGVQAILPVGRASTPRPEWAEGVYAMSNPKLATVIQIEIEGGEDDTCIRNSMQIIDDLNSSCARDGISFSEALVDKSSSYLLAEPEELDRTANLGPSVGRIRTRAAVPEFSMDLSSYLMSYIARSCDVVGVAGSVLTTIRS